jgi:hypothetical protein
MTEHAATRTLVKSPPELWAECSDAGSLGRHLAESFGEIRITRLEPETAVAWEGEHVSGTVRIEPSAWGTRVTLTAQTSEEAVEGEAPVEADAFRQEQVLVEDAVVVEEPEPVVIGEAERFVIEEPVAFEETPEVSDLTPAPAAKRRLMARMRAFFRSAPPPDGVVAVDDPEPDPEPEASQPAELVAAEVEEESVAVAAPADPEPEPDPEPVGTPTAVSEPEAEALSVPEPATDPQAALTAALDSLGQAHHRPFSRA